jgi:hypothetical protein
MRRLKMKRRYRRPERQGFLLACIEVTLWCGDRFLRENLKILSCWRERRRPQLQLYWYFQIQLDRATRLLEGPPRDGSVFSQSLRCRGPRVSRSELFVVKSLHARVERNAEAAPNVRWLGIG